MTGLRFRQLLTLLVLALMAPALTGCSLDSRAASAADESIAVIDPAVIEVDTDRSYGTHTDGVNIYGRVLPGVTANELTQNFLDVWGTGSRANLRLEHSSGATIVAASPAGDDPERLRGFVSWIMTEGYLTSAAERVTMGHEGITVSIVTNTVAGLLERYRESLTLADEHAVTDATVAVEAKTDATSGAEFRGLLQGGVEERETLLEAYGLVVPVLGLDTEEPRVTGVSLQIDRFSDLAALAVRVDELPSGFDDDMRELHAELTQVLSIRLSLTVGDERILELEA